MTRSAKDLLGGAKPQARAQPEASAVPFHGVVEALTRPFTVTEIATLLGMSRPTVLKRITGCPEIERGGKNQGKYLLHQALPYVITPRLDPEQIVKNLKAGDLPPALQEDIWAARLKRQQWESRANELWHTDDILRVFSDAFSRVNQAMALWTERLDEKVGLSDEQYRYLTKQVDALRDDMHRELEEMVKKTHTGPSTDRMANPDEGDLTD